MDAGLEPGSRPGGVKCCKGLTRRGRHALPSDRQPLAAVCLAGDRRQTTACFCPVLGTPIVPGKLLFARTAGGGATFAMPCRPSAKRDVNKVIGRASGGAARVAMPSSQAVKQQPRCGCEGGRIGKPAQTGLACTPASGRTRSSPKNATAHIAGSRKNIRGR
jgi:hypothetical protein